MKQRKNLDIGVARYADIKMLCHYTSLGRSSATKLAKEAGAEKRIGKRCIYDILAIDKYLENIPDEERTS